MKPAFRTSHAGSAALGRGAGFTLVEVLITVAIISVLIAVVLPSLGKALEQGRTFKCQVNLRDAAFDFSLFADEQLNTGRGTDNKSYGRGRFSLATFMESQYEIDEFWAWGQEPVRVRSADSSGDPMRCPEVRDDLRMLKATPCYEGALTPTNAISYALNMRLYWIEQKNPQNGSWGARQVTLTSAIMSSNRVPLIFDVDGADAAEKDVQGIFSAPSAGSTFLYAGDQYWHPTRRHGNGMNVATIDGQVLHTTDPLNEASLDWSFQPPF